MLFQKRSSFISKFLIYLVQWKHKPVRMSPLLLPERNIPLVLKHAGAWLLYTSYLYLIEYLRWPQVKLAYVLSYIVLFCLIFYSSLLLLPLFSRKKGLLIGGFSVLMAFVGITVFAYYYTYKLLPLLGIRLYVRTNFSLSEYMATAIKFFVQYFVYALLYYTVRN